MAFDLKWWVVELIVVSISYVNPLSAKFKMTHCDCLPPCNDVSYKVSSFSVDIEAGQNNSISTI